MLLILFSLLQRCVDAVTSRAYIGQYSQDGSFFVAAFQDQRVRLYDVEHNWKLRKDVRTRMCRCVGHITFKVEERTPISLEITSPVHLMTT